MEIRQLHIGDIEQIQEALLRIFSAPPWCDTWEDAQLHAYAAELAGNANSLCFGLYEGERLAGIALGRVKSWYEGTEYWVEEFGILPEMQQRGLGSRFLSEIETILAGRGFSHIVLLTDRDVPAYHFYRKNGFREQEKNVLFAKRI